MFVWVDSRNELVGSDAVFVDDAGVQWNLDVETGQPSVAAAAPPMYFESSDCSGEELVTMVYRPRQAFGFGLDGGVFMRPDDTTTGTPRTLLSYRLPSGGMCYATSGNAAGIVYPTLRSSQLLRLPRVPTTPFAGPLRRQVR